MDPAGVGAARALLEDVRISLIEAFHGPEWELLHAEGAVAEEGTTWVSGIWRLGQFLGRDGGTPPEVLAVLNQVFERHGFAEQDALAGSPSGWLQLTSDGPDGARFWFRSKGFVEIWATV